MKMEMFFGGTNASLQFNKILGTDRTDRRFEIKLIKLKNGKTIYLPSMFFPRYLPPQPSAKCCLLKHLTNTHPLV